MTVYLINISLLILGYAIWINKRNVNGKAYFCIQATAQWVLLSGLRSTSIGADTGRYEIIFEQVKNIGWNQIFEIAKYSWIANSDYKDPGFYLIQKIFQIFSTDYQVFLVVVAITFFVPMALWIYRYSENALFSYIIFSCLFYSFFAITGTRQTIVTGIAIFLGNELLHKRKYFLYYLMLFLLFPIHKSITTLAIFPILFNKKISNEKIVLWLGAIGISWIFRGKLMTMLSGLVNYEQYDRVYEGAGAKTFVTLFMIILLVGVYVKDYIVTKYECSTEAYNALFIAACLLPLTSINQSAMRAVQYYSIYLVIFLPWLVKAVKKEQRGIITAIGELALIILLTRNNPVYMFFWQ